MRVLVTGPAGFIGKNLVVRLNEQPGFTVLSFSRENTIEELKKLVEVRETRPRRDRSWTFPPLEECRSDFEKCFGIKFTDPG